MKEPSNELSSNAFVEYLEQVEKELDIKFPHIVKNQLLANEKEKQRLTDVNKSLSSELIELKETNSYQSQFLDTLENTLADHGFLLINTRDENLKGQMKKLMQELGVSIND